MPEGGDGGPKLFSADEIARMWQAQQVRFTGDAAELLARIANRPGRGSLAWSASSSGSRRWRRQAGGCRVGLGAPAPVMKDPLTSPTPDNPLRVLAVTRKPDSPSFEQRVLRHVEPLASRGVAVSTHRFDGAALPEVAGFDAVWWHRGLLGPLQLHRLRRLRRHGPPIVLDFDDPLPYSAKGGGRPSLTRRLKFRGLVRSVDAAMAGSRTLAGLAEPWCRDVTVVPMAVDLLGPSDEEQPAVGGDNDGAVSLVWVGSPATRPYLEAILPAIIDAASGRRRPRVRLRVVAHRPIEAEGVAVHYEPWSPEAEDAALRSGDVGLCPMPDTPWTRGKCPYKALQYMAHGLAWIGSDVGENRVTAGPGGERALLAGDRASWVEAIRALADDAPRRRKMGAAGRAYVEANHSRTAVAEKIAGVFRRVAGR